jgi:hypothetical protein
MASGSDVLHGCEAANAKEGAGGQSAAQQLNHELAALVTKLGQGDVNPAERGRSS